MRFSGLFPDWLIVLLTAGLLLAVIVGIVVLARRGVAGKWLFFLGLLRLAAVALFALILLQPLLTRSRTETERPELLILVDRSQSMALPMRTPDVSRWQETTRSLNTGQFAQALGERFQPSWFVFDAGAVAVEDGIAGVQPTGATTRVAEGLEAAVLSQRALGRTVERLLLVTDGVDHGPDDPVATARRLGVVVDVLAPSASSSSNGEELIIADVQCARRLLLGSETHFRLTLRRGGPVGAERQVEVKLSENGQPVREQKLTLKAGSADDTFFLAHRPTTAGWKTYQFQLDADQKPVERSLQVVDQHFEVLVLEDTWRWEYKYLHRLFEDDPSFRFTALLPRGGGAFVQFNSPDRRVNLIGFPQNQAELERFDLFFLGDVNPAGARGFPAALARLVADEGKSLVVIAGPNLSQWAGVPELQMLLPVEVNQATATPIEGPVEARLRPEAAGSAFFFQLRGGVAEQLPPLDRVYPAVRKRPGATVLLEATKQRNAYGNLILLAEHTVGAGRVLWVGTDTLWKWHTLAPAPTGDGPTPYSVFWQQALRALTPERPSVQPVQLWLVPGRSRVEVGQPVALNAEVQTSQLLKRPVLQAHATLPDGGRVPLAFQADPADPKRYRAEFAAPGAGTLQISAQLQLEGKPAAEGNCTLTIEEPRPESADVEVDRIGLTRLAQATGGQMVDPARPDTWPQAPEGGVRTVERTQTLDLWHNFTLLLLLVGVLGLDWFVRLFQGLV